MRFLKDLKGSMTQRSRRTWVLTACTDIVLLSALAVSDAVSLHVVFLVGVVPILIALRLSYATGQHSLLGQPLDERQISVKRRAYMVAYRASFVMAILAVLCLYSIRVYTETAFWGLFWGYFVLLATLPVMASAWLEPDPPSENETPTTVLREERV